jgi:Na+-translocating ferredoxin:NAD+ oxidoreductase RnfD subunit
MAATATTTGTPFQPTRLAVAAALPAAEASVTAARPRGGLDPRLYQIAALAGLLAYGLLRLDLEVRPARAAIILASALAAQYACTRWWRLAAFDPRSALISGLSLCLLLRTSSIALAVAGAVLAVSSKFLIRVRGKHVFNPTNFAIVALLLTGQAWVSPGQWGSAAFFGFLLACLGGLVVNRAARSDVTVAFLLAYGGLVFARSLWLGEPMAIPIHRLQNGALLIFAFFMISDPRTTPDRRAGRVLFALVVALGAAFVQYRLFRTNGLLWSLAVFSPLVPIIDRLLPAAPHRWPREPIRRST